MTAGRLAAVLALAALAGCGVPPPASAPAPAAAAVTRPAAPQAKPSPRPFLPPVKDASGLPGDRLVATRPVRLPGAAADGTARLTAGGRTYLLGQARRVAPGTRPALLLVLPAANTTLREEYDRYALGALRDHGLSIAVVGTYGASWNAGGCCGKAHADGVDDVAAVTAVRDAVVRGTGADPRRVAVLGHSVGALMAWRLACTPAFGAAAAVAVAGTLTHACPRTLQRVPRFLALHGERDASVPLQGSDRVVPLLGVATPSVPESAARLAASAGCAAPRTSAGTTAWSGCAGGGSVALTVLAGRGHAWEDLGATARAAAFLRTVLPGVR